MCRVRSSSSASATALAAVALPGRPGRPYLPGMHAVPRYLCTKNYCKNKLTRELTAATKDRSRYVQLESTARTRLKVMYNTAQLWRPVKTGRGTPITGRYRRVRAAGLLAAYSVRRNTAGRGALLPTPLPLQRSAAPRAAPNSLRKQNQAQAGTCRVPTPCAY